MNRAAKMIRIFLAAVVILTLAATAYSAIDGRLHYRIGIGNIDPKAASILEAATSANSYQIESDHDSSDAAPGVDAYKITSKGITLNRRDVDSLRDALIDDRLFHADSTICFEPHELYRLSTRAGTIDVAVCRMCGKAGIYLDGKFIAEPSWDITPGILSPGASSRKQAVMTRLAADAFPGKSRAAGNGP